MKLLWEQQKRSASLKSSTTMRWHPVLIRWCLSIYLRSPGTYEHLRQTGFLKLPHKSTLQQYTSFTSIGTAYNPDVIQRLYDELDIPKMKEHDKNCLIAFDEMKIKQGLVYSKSNGQLIGFTELGEITEECQSLERQIQDNKSAKPLATHMLCVMARGLFKRFNFPLGCYATTTADAQQLYPILWEAVKILESIGLQVRAFCCDGASTNRKFFLLHKQDGQENVSTDGVTYWTTNRYDSSRKIYFISDVPHLLKTLRNNLENSGANRRSRTLMIDGQQLSWLQLLNLYELDLNIDSFCPGLRKLPKLTNDHINLSSRTRMRVNLAAQVLSKTVADALSHQGYPSTKKLETFIRYCDKWFDCMNVQTTFQGQKLLKESLKPYTDINDPRFVWLENVFLKFFNDWKQQTNSLPGTKGMQAKHCISRETLDGLRITVRSFIELVPDLLRLDGVQYFLSDKLNQDPVEEHFGKQRMRGGGIENPSVEMYMLNERKIIVAKSDMIRSIRGNTRGRIRERTDIDVTCEKSLPKKRKLSK